jgi:hypothetical protein
MVVHPTVKGVEHRKLAEKNTTWSTLRWEPMFFSWTIEELLGGVDIFMKAESLFFSSKWSWQHVSER